MIIDEKEKEQQNTNSNNEDEQNLPLTVTAPEQKPLFEKIKRFCKNPKEIFKLCWVVGLLVCLGIIAIFIDALSLYAHYKNMESISQGIGALLAFCNFVRLSQFVVNITLALTILSTLVLLYCLYNNKQWVKTHISANIYFGVLLQLVFQISQIPAINKVVSAINELKSGDYGSILGSALMMDGNSAETIPNPFTTGNIVFIIILLVLMIANSVIIGFRIYSPRSAFLNALERKTDISIIKSKHKAVKLNKRTVYVLCGIGIAVIICAGVFAGRYIYSKYIYKNEVDLIKTTRITYDTTALSGSSTAQIKYSWPDRYKDNVEIENFINSVKFKLNKTSGLANGDKIELQATVDQSMQSKYRIKLAGKLHETITVKGLSHEIESVKELPSGTLQQWQEEGMNNIKKENTDDESTKSTATFIGWYVEDTANDYFSTDSNYYTLAALYKVHTDHQDFYSYSEDNYYTYSVSDIILDKSNALETGELKKEMNDIYISDPSEMSSKGYKKID